MNFTFETQGATTYLVCELAPTDQLDSLTLGMLSNNRIVGIAPVLYTEMNGQRFLKYNISAKLTLSQFFSGPVDKSRALSAFKNIINAICNADDYMIDQNCFAFEADKIFINVSNYEVGLICVPVATQKYASQETENLFRGLLESTQFTGDKSFVAELENFIANSKPFNIYAFRDLIERLSSGMGVAQQYQQPPVQGASVPPAMAFNDTISMDDLNRMQSQQPIPQSPVQPQGQPMGQGVPVQPQGMPMQQPPVSNPGFGGQAPPMQGRPMAPGQPPMQGRPMSPMQPPMPGQPGVPVQQPAPQKPKKEKKKKSRSGSGLDVAIPGQAQAQKQQNVVMPPNGAQQPQAQAQDDEKKITFMDLMAHYNKENVAKYKAQKEAKKSSESKKKKEAPQPTPGQQLPPQYQQNAAPIPQRPQGMPMQQGAPIPQQGMPMQQPPASQFSPAPQPVPVQNSFNETTVLSNFGMGGGETTVLSMGPDVVNPCLTRVKTGEKVYINKPVFRIGKEKSYVDYFIADNTAISRSHCNIHTENGEYFIEDTNSTNHTFINGKIINSNVKTKISSGDRIRLANEEFTFTI